MTSTFLAGDLGGTKTLLALAQADAKGFRILHEQRFASADYDNFPDLLGTFLKAFDIPVSAACFGLAGPTDGHSAQLTYLPWHLDGAALVRQFDLGQVSLINDFVAAAHGIDQLQPGQLRLVQAGQPREQAPRLVIGAGTGLGIAGLIWQEGRYQPVPGEGGHSGFAPQNPQQMELWRYLFAGSGRVTAEDVLCGEGIRQLYLFLGGEAKSPASIGEAAISGRDPRATQTLDLWLALYGAFAGDQALNWLPHGGIYIAGGLASKLMPNLRLKPFIEAFRAKREHRSLVESFPVHLVLEERLGLLGALAKATQSQG